MMEIRQFAPWVYLSVYTFCSFDEQITFDEITFYFSDKPDINIKYDMHYTIMDCLVGIHHKLSGLHNDIAQMCGVFPLSRHFGIITGKFLLAKWVWSTYFHAHLYTKHIWLWIYHDLS